MIVAPLPCHWFEDEHGGRFLIPGCWARVEDPDIDTCGCVMLDAQLTAARADVEALRAELASARAWHDQVVVAVHAHHDGKQIMRSAAAS